MNKEKALELYTKGKLSDNEFAQILLDKKPCSCNAKSITVSGAFGDWEADSEPYENGVYEDIEEEHQGWIDSLELHITATICTKCKEVVYYSEDGEIVGKDVVDV